MSEWKNVFHRKYNYTMGWVMTWHCLTTYLWWHPDFPVVPRSGSTFARSWVEKTNVHICGLSGNGVDLLIFRGNGADREQNPIFCVVTERLTCVIVDFSTKMGRLSFHSSVLKTCGAHLQEISRESWRNCKYLAQASKIIIVYNYSSPELFFAESPSPPSEDAMLLWGESGAWRDWKKELPPGPHLPIDIPSGSRNTTKSGLFEIGSTTGMCKRLFV